MKQAKRLRLLSDFAKHIAAVSEARALQQPTKENAPASRG
jgi:hypothetical protein